MNESSSLNEQVPNNYIKLFVQNITDAKITVRKRK